jgi:hypothetical protein
MLAHHLNQILLVIRHPDIDPSRMQILWTRCFQKLGIRLRVEIEGAECIIFAEVDAEVCAAGIACLAVEQVEVALVIKVAETVLDVLVAQVVVVVGKVFGGRGGSEGTCHD